MASPDRQVPCWLLSTSRTKSQGHRADLIPCIFENETVHTPVSQKEALVACVHTTLGPALTQCPPSLPPEPSGLNVPPPVHVCPPRGGWGPVPEHSERLGGARSIRTACAPHPHSRSNSGSLSPAHSDRSAPAWWVINKGCRVPLGCLVYPPMVLCGEILDSVLRVGSWGQGAPQWQSWGSHWVCGHSSLLPAGPASKSSLQSFRPCQFDSFWVSPVGNEARPRVLLLLCNETLLPVLYQAANPAAVWPDVGVHSRLPGGRPGSLLAGGSVLLGRWLLA